MATVALKVLWQKNNLSNLRLEKILQEDKIIEHHGNLPPTTAQRNVSEHNFVEIVLTTISNIIFFHISAFLAGLTTRSNNSFDVIRKLLPLQSECYFRWQQKKKT